MKRLLLLLPFLLTATPVQAEVDTKIAEFCMKATDFAGCVQTMTGGLPPKQQQDAEDGLRTWTRDDGTIARMRISSVVALKNKGKYGRYLEYRYGLERKNNHSMWGVQADCQDYTANWDKDAEGWKRLNDPAMYLRPGERSSMNQPAREAKAVLDEFCPIIDTLPQGGDVK
jgi:hypothetical protein